MNLWQKFTGNGASDSDEPEIQMLENQLERLKYRARPEFQADLKNRLLANFEAEQPTKIANTGSFSQQVKNFLKGPNITRLALSGFGMAALVVLIISVLAANSLNNARPNQQLQPVAAATSSSTTQNQPNKATDKLQLFSPATKTYLTAVEASRQLGFTVKQPTYLPASYKLNSAFLNVASGPVPVQIVQGYQLNYTAPKLNGSAREIEIAEWQTPAPISTAPGKPGNAAGAIEKFGTVNGAKVTTIELSKGVQAYYLEGSKWQIPIFGGVQIVEKTLPSTSVVIGGAGAEEGPPPPPQIIAVPAEPAVGITLTEATATLSQDFSISIANGKPVTGSRTDVVLEFGNQTGGVTVKTLLWQQNNRLLLISADESVAVDELKKIALGLFESR